MAEIYFCEDESEEAQYEGDDSNMVTPEEITYQDDHLTPVAKLEKYADSNEIFNRQSVVRSIQDTLRTVIDTPDVSKVLHIMVKLSDDSEPNVRAELMEQVPHVAMFCQECPQQLSYIVHQYLLPMVVKYLTDTNNQVRKTSQAALLVLLEQELVDKVDVEEQVCPVILQLTEHGSIDDYRTEAVALMSKMSPLIGKDMTERLFLDRFSLLCTDTLFHVRKVCAANFGDICTVTGTEATEVVLLSKFFNLCEDGIWGVRKACAECFMAVSCACTLEVRRNELAPLFINLLCDQSRWVRMAAFQSLGPFISTFADSKLTGLYFDDEGVLTYHNPEENFQNQKSVAESKVVDTNGNLEDKNKVSHTEGVENLNFHNLTNKEDNHNELVNNLLKDNNLRLQDIPIVDDAINMDMDDCDDCKAGLTDQNVVKNQSFLVNLEELSWEEKRATKYEERTDSINGHSFRSLELDFLSKQNSFKSTCNSKSILTSMTYSPSCSKTLGNCSKSTSPVVSTLPSRELPVHLDNEAAFNSFHFWRLPVPEIDVTLDLAHVNDQEYHHDYASNFNSTVKQKDNVVETQVDALAGALAVARLKSLSQCTLYNVNSTAEKNLEMKCAATTQIHIASISTVSDTTEIAANLGTTHVISTHVNEATVSVVNGEVNDLSSHDVSVHNINQQYIGTAKIQPAIEEILEQVIVPSALLGQYISMTDPSRAQTVDTEIPRHCAFSLAAVAYTLGRKHWYCLKDTYEILASDMQWKVRRALAFSIHELAVILGEEITARDLVPVFNEFFKDLDEVRIGVLKHLADFISLLKPMLRQQYLPRFVEFLDTDNHRNWRFRLELAEQLIQLCDLYSSTDIRYYIVPITKALAVDKVSEVRHLAYRVLSVILRTYYNNDDKESYSALQKELVQNFANISRWKYRQTYCHMCHYFLDGKAISHELYAQHFLPTLLTLSKDPVPNVRIAVARTLSNLIALEYYSSNQNPYHAQLLTTILTLHNDPDRDVRYYASSATHFMHHKDTVSV